MNLKLNSKTMYDKKYNTTEIKKLPRKVKKRLKNYIMIRSKIHFFHTNIKIKYSFLSIRKTILIENYSRPLFPRPKKNEFCYVVHFSFYVNDQNDFLIIPLTDSIYLASKKNKISKNFKIIKV